MNNFLFFHVDLLRLSDVCYEAHSYLRNERQALLRRKKASGNREVIGGQLLSIQLR